MSTAYVHGYHARENQRLRDQAGSRVLEAGCGVGAQTVTLAVNSPDAQITSIDVSERSIAAATAAVEGAGLSNVTFRRADLFDLPFPAQSFDHVFVCFVLEHLAEPVAALRRLKAVLKTGGTLTVIEGDHGSAYFHPRSDRAQRAIQCLVDLQARARGDALIGRALFPLVSASGYADVRVSPRMVYVDASRPQLVEGFTKLTFTAMVEGVRDAAIAAGMLTAAEFDAGVADLYRTAEADGTFCYTFFKATAVTA
jgi:SAM-dependent methyltransferase